MNHIDKAIEDCKRVVRSMVSNEITEFFVAHPSLISVRWKHVVIDGWIDPVASGPKVTWKDTCNLTGTQKENVMDDFFKRFHKAFDFLGVRSNSVFEASAYVGRPV